MEEKNGRLGPQSTNRLAKILNEGKTMFDAEVKTKETVTWELDDLKDRIKNLIPEGATLTAFTEPLVLLSVLLLAEE